MAHGQDSTNVTADTAVMTRLDSVIQYGNTLVGHKYRPGGKTPPAFDCSGLQYYIFSKYGEVMPAFSGGYSNEGVAVEWDSLKVGDFLLFKGRNSKATRIGHVGIVCKIENGVIYMLHSESRGVVIDDFMKIDYYRKRYVGARRLFNADLKRLKR